MNQEQQDELLSAVREYGSARARAAVAPNSMTYRAREEAFDKVMDLVRSTGARQRALDKAQAQNRREWNTEAVEAQHRFRVDDARADYIADNYSPKDY